MSNDYCQRHLPVEIIEKLESGAFRSLCQHLQERSNEVSNIDLMNLSGFCRNCLAKWMVLEARRLVDKDASDVSTSSPTISLAIRQALDTLGYDEAAQHVYGMTYSDWKKLHQTKASKEQMEQYNALAETSLFAQHDKELLRPRQVALPTEENEKIKVKQPIRPNVPLSNVCCEDVDQVATTASNNQAGLPTIQPSNHDTFAPFQPPLFPKFSTSLKLGILTVSDRAFSNKYETGDLSGLAVEQAVKSTCLDHGLEFSSFHYEIKPDEEQAIAATLISWSDVESLDLILTTGGTGLSRRDVTPDATRHVLTTECAGLMQFVLTECSRLQPLSSLSRGTAGIRNRTVIANLPGNPKAVYEMIPLLLPLLLHAVADVRYADADKII